MSTNMLPNDFVYIFVCDFVSLKKKHRPTKRTTAIIICYRAFAVRTSSRPKNLRNGCYTYIKIKKSEYYSVVHTDGCVLRLLRSNE